MEDIGTKDQDVPASDAPKILITFGGVAVGKTTARRAVMSLLDMSGEALNCGADEIQEGLPEFKEAFASGDRERLEKFCEDSWSEVKRLQHEKIHAALDSRLSIFLEWCNERQFNFVASGTSQELPAEKWEPHGYELVICLAKCLDPQCAVVAARKREEIDGRHIAEQYVNNSQKDRALHFVNAAVAIRDRALAVGTFTSRFVSAIRRTPDGAAEITVLSSGDLRHCDTEEEAQNLLDQLCIRATS